MEFGLTHSHGSIGRCAVGGEPLKRCPDCGNKVYAFEPTPCWTCEALERQTKRDIAAYFRAKAAQ